MQRRWLGPGTEGRDAAARVEMEGEQRACRAKRQLGLAMTRITALTREHTRDQQRAGS